MPMVFAAIAGELGRQNAASQQKLKGLGHAILANFSTDEMVIELTKMWK